MAVSIREAQSQLLRSGILNNLGSTKNDSLPYDSILEEITALWADKSFIPAVKTSITKNKLEASKDLLQSVGSDVTIRGNNIVRFRLLMAKHWIFADEGRRKGKRPPIKAIEKWITFKGITVRQTRADSKLSVLQRRRKMARSIAAAIGKRGTIKRFNYKGSKFFQKVAPGELRILSDLATKALGYAIVIDLKMTLRNSQKGKK
jgi:hypothetical protein